MAQVSEMGKTILRIVIQIALVLPALSSAAVLPLPGLLALVASVALPDGDELGRITRWLVVAGLVMALAACIAIATLLMQGSDGVFSTPLSPAQGLAILGPLGVTIWNLARMTGKNQKPCE
jgi:uncharacterized membrane protein